MKREKAYKFLKRKFKQPNSHAIMMAIACMVGIIATGCATSTNLSPDLPESLFRPNTSVIIEPGDILKILFFFHPELNQVQMVRPDGKLAMTFFQSVQAAGLTPDEFQKELVTLYSKEFVDPVITVTFEQRTSRSVYVAGEVDGGGVKPLATNATVGQILTLCSVRMKRAALNSVILIRRYSDTEYRAYQLDVNYESGKERDVYLAGGDILFIPRNNISKINDFVQQYIRDVIPPQMSMSLGYTYELNRQID